MAWLQCAFVCVEALFNLDHHCYHQSIHPTVPSCLPASTHPSNTLYICSFGSSSLYMHGFIIHLSHSSVCPLTHLSPHPSISWINIHLTSYYSNLLHSCLFSAFPSPVFWDKTGSEISLVVFLYFGFRVISDKSHAVLNLVVRVFFGDPMTDSEFSVFLLFSLIFSIAPFLWFLSPISLQPPSLQV